MKVAITTCLLLLVACAPSGRLPEPSPTPSAGWSTHDAAGLRIEAPTTWLGPEVLPAMDSTGAPRTFVVFHDANGAEAVTLLTWPDATASSIAATQFNSEYPQGPSSQQLTVVDGTRTRTVVAVTAYGQWYDASGAGTYECRHLYVQVDPRLVADVIACGAHVKGNSTPTPELRRMQEQVALRLGLSGGQP